MITRILSAFRLLKRVGFALLLCGGTAQSEWHRVHVFEDELTWVVRFQDAENGWAGPALLGPSLYRTTNGGTDWIPVDGFPSNGDIAEMEFWGRKHVAVVTLNSVTISSDSGTTWSEIALPGGGYATELAYVDSNFLFAVGTDDQLFPPTRKQIHRSLDGGQTWARVYYEVDPAGWSINDVAYSQSGTVIVGSAPWEVLRSTDQGSTWQSIGNEDPAQFPVLDIQALVSPSSGVFIAAGSIDTLPGLLGFPVIARSSDDGQSWDVVWQNSTAYDSMIYDVSFADSLNGWAVGRNGAFLRTSNGGETWAWSVFDSIRFGLTFASYLSTSVGYVFDPGGGGGSLWRWDTTTGGVSSNPVADNFQFLAYPNPFNSTLTISLLLPPYESVTVRLYDLLGREVDVIHRGRLLNTQLSYTAPASLASGIYFLRAETAARVAVQKVMLLK